MVTKIFLMFFIFLWLACRGILEGMVWTNQTRIGFLDYHGLRILENLGIVGALVVSSLIEGVRPILLIIGAYIFGTYAVYERLLNKVQANEWFVRKEHYTCFGITFPRFNFVTEFVLALIIGSFLMVIGFMEGF